MSLKTVLFLHQNYINRVIKEVMKTVKKSVIFVISSIFAVVSFTACSADDDIIEQAPTFIKNREYPVSDVKMTSSGIVRVETKKNFTRDNVGELKPEDFNIRQVSAPSTGAVGC